MPRRRAGPLDSIAAAPSASARGLPREPPWTGWRWGKADRRVFVFGALLLAFALMQVDLTAIRLLVGAYLLVQGYAVYCRVRLEKEM